MSEFPAKIMIIIIKPSEGTATGRPEGLLGEESERPQRSGRMVDGQQTGGLLTGGGLVGGRTDEEVTVTEVARVKESNHGPLARP